MLRDIREFSSHAIRHGLYIENLCLSVCKKHNHPWENISTLKESKKFGDVRRKMYFCIRLAASQHNDQAILSFCVRFAQSLHKIGGGSA